MPYEITKDYSSLCVIGQIFLIEPGQAHSHTHLRASDYDLSRKSCSVFSISFAIYCSKKSTPI